MTNIRLLPTMYQHMCFKVFWPGENFGAICTGIRLFSTVYMHMLLKVSRACEGLGTLCIHNFSLHYASICESSGSKTEWRIGGTVGSIMFLTTVCQCMFIKAPRLSKRFVTLFTYIRLLTTMCQYMFLRLPGFKWKILKWESKNSLRLAMWRRSPGRMRPLRPSLINREAWNIQLHKKSDNLSTKK